MESTQERLTIQDTRDAMAHANRMPDAFICLLAHRPTGDNWQSERYIRYLLSLYPSTPMHDRQKERILQHPALLAAFAKRIEERIRYAYNAVNYLDPEEHVQVHVIDHSLKWTLNMAHFEPTHVDGETPVRTEVYIES